MGEGIFTTRSAGSYRAFAHTNSRGVPVNRRCHALHRDIPGRGKNSWIVDMHKSIIDGTHFVGTLYNETGARHYL